MTDDMPHDAALSLDGVDKDFTLHLQGSQVLPVVRDVAFDVPRGRCVVLGGESGAGKSTIMKMVFGSYGASRGRILLRHGGSVLDLATAAPRDVIAARRDTMGYVSQFLRAVPRVAAVDVVAEPLVERGTARGQARERAGELLARLSIPERLWGLPPATFSGGEQQRVNIARGFAIERPLMLLDEPTASLDARNRGVVIEMIRERLDAGTGMLAIFHDADVREAVADDIVDVRRFAPAREEVAA
ncbi:phosphonate C-P lyase system protein PhnL [Microbacterium karelineae]|uniref:phosphonate C-P lyase system protein PhnL n=1 Tax=Microbacterium karelineae TaxID=2654283 RepID=UPI0018D3C129|nr:phosphonate C-P lyase system protein PhnL [Microbacterium karelineae]